MSSKHYTYALLGNFGLQMEATELFAMLFLVINFDLRCPLQSALTYQPVLLKIYRRRVQSQDRFATSLETKSHIPLVI